ncbi:MAG: IclR family transcriptional regulator [Ectothiorhodospiraceae bacterium]|nr:IclR family transcriptional regulator [Ectothiorhodospiraceae bacterium]
MVRSLARAVEVLDCFSLQERDLTLGRIARRTGLPKATVHRLLGALRDAGLVSQDGNRDRYRLGLKLLALAGIVMADLDLFRVAGPHVERLVNLSGEAAHLCAFDGRHVIAIDRREMQPGRNETVMIEREPPYCTGTGKAILAHQPAEVIERVIADGLDPFTAHTITDPERLRTELALVARRGYAIDDEERQPGIRCVGAPISDASGAVVGAVSATGPAERFPDGRLPTLAELVVDTARRIGDSLVTVQRAARA